MINENIILSKLIIETSRLIIRRFGINDSLDYFPLLSDKNTCYNNGFEPFMEIDDEYNELMKQYSNDVGRYVIELKSNKIVGTIHLTNCDEGSNTKNKKLEIGYSIIPSYRQKGYAYEAVKALVDLLLSRLNVEIIVATIPSNIPSLNLIKKLDFTYEKTETKAFYHPQYGLLDLMYFVKKK